MSLTASPPPYNPRNKKQQPPTASFCIFFVNIWLAASELVQGCLLPKSSVYGEVEPSPADASHIHWHTGTSGKGDILVGSGEETRGPVIVFLS